MTEETRLIRATLGAARAGEALHAGPVFASPFHLKGNPDGTGYTYGRAHNPTWTELEGAIANLEGQGCAGVRVFGSGMAAVAAVIGAVLRPGDTVVVPVGGYFAGRRLLEEMFVPMGVTVRAVPVKDLAGACQGARLVWLETPSNPRLEITDLQVVIAAAHAAGALVAVDNSTASPMGQKPLAFGADFSVCSDSKSMCGHSDLVMGHVGVASEEWLGRVDRERTLRGAIVGPMEAWLGLRSLATLSLRMEKSCSNALAIASFLEGRVGEVLYPGLVGHAGHKIAARQMKYFGPVLGFDLATREAAEAFLARAELVTEATSFGGVSTTGERRVRWGNDDVGPGFIRLSAGCEAVEDLLADIEGALRGI